MRQRVAVALLTTLPLAAAGEFVRSAASGSECRRIHAGHVAADFKRDPVFGKGTIYLNADNAISG